MWEPKAISGFAGPSTFHDIFFFRWDNSAKLKSFKFRMSRKKTSRFLWRNTSLKKETEKTASSKVRRTIEQQDSIVRNKNDSFQA